MCKVCSRLRSRKYYTDNKEEHKKLILEKKKDRIEENRVFVLDFLKKHPCVDCGETDPIILEFDHLRDKKYGICQLVNQGFSREILQAEIEKCEIRCANCHRRKTSRDCNSYRVRDALGS